MQAPHINLPWISWGHDSLERKPCYRVHYVARCLTDPACSNDTWEPTRARSRTFVTCAPRKIEKDIFFIDPILKNKRIKLSLFVFLAAKCSTKNHSVSLNVWGSNLVCLCKAVRFKTLEATGSSRHLTHTKFDYVSFSISISPYIYIYLSQKVAICRYRQFILVFNSDM